VAAAAALLPPPAYVGSALSVASGDGVEAAGGDVRAAPATVRSPERERSVAGRFVPQSLQNRAAAWLANEQAGQFHVEAVTGGDEWMRGDDFPLTTYQIAGTADPDDLRPPRDAPLRAA
jgi:hypothetical protein